MVGEEITTTDGELIGLFLERRIPPGLTAKQTVIEIKKQAGLVYLEHPYDQFRRHLSEAADAVVPPGALGEFAGGGIVHGRDDKAGSCR